MQTGIQMVLAASAGNQEFQKSVQRWPNVWISKINEAARQCVNPAKYEVKTIHEEDPGFEQWCNNIVAPSKSVLFYHGPHYILIVYGPGYFGWGMATEPHGALLTYHYNA